METMRLAIGTAVLLALAGLGAEAAEEDDFMIRTGADLVTLCAVPPEHPNYAAALHMCHGYLVGVHHMHQAMGAAMADDAVYCVPETGAPSRSEAVDGFVAWTNGRDGLDETPALATLLRWAEAEFPCREGADG